MITPITVLLLMVNISLIEISLWILNVKYRNQQRDRQQTIERKSI